jgi:hypothetical protein
MDDSPDEAVPAAGTSAAFPLDANRLDIRARGADAMLGPLSFQKPQNRPAADIVGARNLALRLLTGVPWQGRSPSRRRPRFSYPWFVGRQSAGQSLALCP